jgi:hypothetical protein
VRVKASFACKAQELPVNTNYRPAGSVVLDKEVDR